MNRIMIGVVLLLLAAAAWMVHLHRDVSEEATYVTSERCAGCHPVNYHSWKHNTLHPKMFRPVRSPDDILGDFTSDDPALTFTKEEVEYVVGNKWEQVYVRMIDGEYYPLPAKWYVQLEKWVPYKVKDWHETPMSKKCNGCHTTGFDPVSYEFSEFGIGCEACHGPASLHVRHERMEHDSACNFCHDREEGEDESGDVVIRSVSSSVCAQCHTRGSNAKSGEVEAKSFNFPVNVTPGADLERAFNQLGPKQDKKGKYWWGIGISKNRHQEYADWQQSKHSQSLREMLANYQEGGERGKLADECLHCHSTDYRMAEEGKRPTLDTAKHGVTCVACHEPHGLDKKTGMAHDGTGRCGDCHIDSMSHHASRKARAHYPCPPGLVTCADCHMPRVVKTGGYFSLRSHAFRIITPHEAELTRTGKGEAMPSSCQNGGCHEDRSIEWAKQAFDEHYSDMGDGAPAAEASHSVTPAVSQKVAATP